MKNTNKMKRYSIILNIIIWGSIWGIFESTVGYLLHVVSFGYSWIIWYPFACFIMTNVYYKNNNVSSILYVGMFSATIKMLNLCMPGRIDRVINPAVSIMFEALAMVSVIFVVNLLTRDKQKNLHIKVIMALTMNTGWRALFAFYLFFLVPDWIRDISVISSTDKFVSFFIIQNCITSALIFIGYQFKTIMLRVVKIIENKISMCFYAIPKRAIPALRVSAAALMIGLNITLQFILE